MKLATLLRPLGAALTLGVLVLGASRVAQAAQTHVAVAANFADAAKEIAAAFKAKTGDEAILSSGSSGAALYPESRRARPSRSSCRPTTNARKGSLTTGSGSRRAASPTRSARWSCGAATLAG